MNIGLHYGMSNAAYHSSLGVSNSGLALIAKSPAHFYGRKLDPARPPEPESTAAQLVGTLAHCALLEPADFARRYPVGPDVSRNTKVWHAFVDSLKPGQVGIKEADRATAFAMAAAARRIPDIDALLENCRTEVSAYALDPATGELIKCRPDVVSPVDDESVILCDVKTYSDASPRAFARQVASMGYHVQDAFYSQVYALASGKRVAGFVFLAMETAWPHVASACMLDDESRAKGAAEARARLDRYAECKRLNFWPPYSTNVELINLPAWA
jgi:hypothetical protein